jgi:hypothetical protein
VRLQYLATTRLRVPYVTTEPPTLMINGCMCQAGAHVDLAAGMFSGGAAIWYVFANRTPGSTTFTLSVNTSASEGADQRIIGEAYWDGSALVRVKDYFGSPLGDPDYESGWFAVAYNNAYTRAHSLAQVPKLVVIEHADNGSGTGELVPVLINYAADYKSPVGYDASNIYFNAQNNTAFGVLISTRRSSGGGYLRMRAWK